MRKVVVYELLSLDGVAEQPDAFVTVVDDVMRENLGRVVATQDSVLLGRRTYDDWAVFWPTSDIEPFAGFINGVEKFVVTSTRPGHAWTNTTVIDGGLTDFVADLKRASGGDIGVHGSIALAQSLFEWGLVDELRLVIAPAVHTHGRKLFDRGVGQAADADAPGRVSVRLSPTRLRGRELSQRVAGRTRVAGGTRAAPAFAKKLRARSGRCEPQDLVLHTLNDHVLLFVATWSVWAYVNFAKTFPGTYGR